VSEGAGRGVPSVLRAAGGVWVFAFLPSEIGDNPRDFLPALFHADHVIAFEHQTVGINVDLALAANQPARWHALNKTEFLPLDDVIVVLASLVSFAVVGLRGGQCCGDQHCGQSLMCCLHFGVLVEAQPLSIHAFKRRRSCVECNAPVFCKTKPHQQGGHMRKSLNISHSSTAAFNRALLLVTAFSLACNAGAQEAPAKINDRAESGGVALTVVKATRQATIGNFQKADKDQTFLVAEVVIETTGSDEASYNPGFFRVKDSSGVEYDGISAAGATNSLKYGKLPKGEKVRGTIAFNIPKDAKGLVLSYDPHLRMAGYKLIRVALE
jgi:Domain of unknown function (DUF4352)